MEPILKVINRVNINSEVNTLVITLIKMITHNHEIKADFIPTPKNPLEDRVHTR